MDELLSPPEARARVLAETGVDCGDLAVVDAIARGERRALVRRLLWSAVAVVLVTVGALLVATSSTGGSVPAGVVVLALAAGPAALAVRRSAAYRDEVAPLVKAFHRFEDLSADPGAMARADRLTQAAYVMNASPEDVRRLQRDREKLRRQKD